MIQESREQSRTRYDAQAQLLEERHRVQLGVVSRHELVARVFLDEYLPEVARKTPLTSRGRFDRE